MQVPPHVPSFDPNQPRATADQQNFTPGSSEGSLAWGAFALLLLSLLVELLTKAEPWSRLLPAVLVTFCFAVFARLLGGVTISGAAAGFLVTLILFLADGPRMFGVVLLVFVLTFLATKFGRSRKQSRSIAERASGRDAAQVLANVGCAALAAACAYLFPCRAALLAGSIAALAEAASDTVSSEIGKAAAKDARMITSGQIVPAGTDGAISMPGTLAGIVAAAFVGLEAFSTGILTLRMAVIAGVSGIFGMFFDSAIGATLERRGWLTNNGVNLISTGFSVLAAILLAKFP
jgi:uncharacterized protein (TIGR00297 family)